MDEEFAGGASGAGYVEDPGSLVVVVGGGRVVAGGGRGSVSGDEDVGGVGARITVEERDYGREGSEFVVAE